MSEVVVLIGPGSIGQAIARRVSAGKQVLLAGLHQRNANAAAEVLSNAGFDVNTATVDVSSRESIHALVQAAIALGEITGVIHAAGVLPARHARRRSSGSICTAPPWCWRNSGMSSPQVVPAS